MDLDEAIRTYAWQDDFAHTVDQIRNHTTGSLAHAEITGATTAEVWLKSSLPDRAAGALSDFAVHFPHVDVQVVTDYGISEDEIEAAIVAAHFAVFESHPQTASEFDFERKSVLVTVSDPTGVIDVGPLEQKANLAVSEAVEGNRSISVEVRPSDERTLGGDDSGSYHHGGEYITNGSKYCTTGFGVTHTSGWRRGSTAGHCKNDMSDDSDSLTVTHEYDSLWGDFQLHWGADTQTDDFYSGNSSTTETTKRDLSGFSTAVAGQTLNKNGANTHRTQDTVRNISVCHDGNCYMLQMHNRKAAGGDSGGPVFWGYTAYGTHEGYMWSWFKNRDTVSRADSLHEALPGWNWWY